MPLKPQASCGAANLLRLTGSLLLGLLLTATVAGAPSDALPPQLSAEQLQRLKDRDKLDDDAQESLAKGEFAAAIASNEKAFSIEREVLGESDRPAFLTMRSLARLSALSGDFATARRWAAQALAIQTKARDSGHWLVRAARRTSDEVEQFTRMTPQQLARLREAEQLSARVMQLAKKSDFKAALGAALRALDIRKAELAPEHPDCLTAQATAGWVYRNLQDYDHAEPLLRACLAARERVLGDDHPDFALSNNTLAWLVYYKQDYSQAEALFRRAAESYRRAEGLWSRNYSATLNNLAMLYVQTKAYRRAEALRLQMLDIRKRLQGENHTDYATALQGLSDVYQYLEEYDKAEPLAVQALAIFKKNLGPKDAHTIDAMRGLSFIYRHRGQPEKALSLEREALDLQKQTLGPDNADIGLALHQIGSIYVSIKDYSRALEYERQSAEVFRKSMGDKSERYRGGMNNIAWLLAQSGTERKREEFPAAHRAIEEQLEILGKLHGQKNWQLVHIRLDLAYVDELAKMPPAQRRELQAATDLFDKVYESNLSKPREMLPLAEQVLETRRRILGDEHPHTLESWAQVGFLCKNLGDYAKAKPIREKLVKLMHKVKGDEHPDYGSALHNLANLNESMGDFRQAIELYQQAVEVWKKAYGPNSDSLANTFNSLAYCHEALGDYHQAEALYRQAVEMRREVLGPRSVQYADALRNLGGFYMWALNDDAKAEPLLEEAVAIYKFAVGEKHPDYASGIDFLASFYSRSDQFDRAESLYRQALTIRQQALGEKHLHTAMTLHNLATLYLRKRDYDQAASLYLQALAIDEAISGKTNPKNVITLRQLAHVYRDSGKLAEAERALQKAVDIGRQSVGMDNPDSAESLSQLALVYAMGDEPQRGVAPALEALQLARAHFERTSDFLAERRQLAMRTKLGNFIDNYLYVSARAGVPAEDVYPHVLSWKGMVGAGQQQLRALYHRLEKGGNKEVAMLATELEGATQSLAEQSRARADGDREQRFRLEELSDKIEQLQQQLASMSLEFRQQREQSRRTVDDVRKVLPENAVLVDFLSYAHPLAAKENDNAEPMQARIVGFVLRHGRPVERIEFGSTELIGQTIATWRVRYGAKTATLDPGARLRELLWKPLESHLAGASVLLISPTSTLSPLPWAAIPGEKPGTYLIDELGIAVVPIPRLLPELLAADPPIGRAEKEPSLLVIGDVDFGAEPSRVDLAMNTRSAVRGGQSLYWAALPGTRDEIAAVKASFGKRYAAGAVTNLVQNRATKRAIRAEAGQHEYLHFSTHGFFAPPEVQSAATTEGTSGSMTDDAAGARQSVSGYHPGLLSGLVLAGANRAAEVGQDDGILTALEVEELDLSRVQLATLSACETGLGKSGGGEGLLGLQRAFQTAGAHSVLAGLWKVPDRATQALMTRFYANLWQKKMSRLEALREAQRWMIREGSKIPGGLRGLDASAADQQQLEQSDRLPPFYWAAFVLSGDWR